MPRPAGVPDPRDPDSPLRLADPAEDARRSMVSLRALQIGMPVSRVGEDLPAEPVDFDAIVERIGEERWEELRRRFVVLLAALRRARTLGGGD
jgi:hypothetical protein